MDIVIDSDDMKTLENFDRRVILSKSMLNNSVHYVSNLWNVRISNLEVLNENYISRYIPFEMKISEFDKDSDYYRIREKYLEEKLGYPSISSEVMNDYTKRIQRITFYIRGNINLYVRENQLKYLIKQLDLFSDNDFFICYRDEFLQRNLRDYIKEHPDLPGFYYSSATGEVKKALLNITNLDIDRFQAASRELDIALNLPTFGDVDPTLANLKNFERESLNSKRDRFYIVTGCRDKDNVKRIREGKMPIFEYPFHENTPENDRVRIKASILYHYAIYAKDNNLPTLYPMGLVSSIREDGFMCPNSLIRDLVYEKISIKNLQIYEFNDLDDLAYKELHLSKLNIKFLRICNFLVYKSDRKLDFDIIDKEYLYNMVVENLKEHTNGKHYDPVSMRFYNSLPIHELVECNVAYGSPYFPKIYSDIEYVNNGKLLEFNFFRHFELNLSGLYDVRGVINGILRSHDIFSRYQYCLPGEPEIVENEGDYKFIFMGREIYTFENLDDNDLFIWKLTMKQLWKKGYLLSDYGLTYYMTTGEISPYSIQLPEWLDLEKKDAQEFAFQITL